MSDINQINGELNAILTTYALELKDYDEKYMFCISLFATGVKRVVGSMMGADDSTEELVRENMHEYLDLIMGNINFDKI